MSWKWVPNALSILRIAASAPLAVLIHLALVTPGVEGAGLARWAFVLFAAIAFTDWLDGWAARVLDAKTVLGGKLDLWGDKALVALCLLAGWTGWLNLGGVHGDPVAGLLVQPWTGLAGLLAVVALPVRDAMVTRLRAQVEGKGGSLPPSFLAKSKTAVVMAGFAVTLAGLGWGMGLVVAGGLMLVAAGAAMSIITAAQYWAVAARFRGT